MASHDGAQSVTSKLDIGKSSIYVHVSWMMGKIVHIDVTLSRGVESALDALPKTLAQAELEASNYDLGRSWVEESCRKASRLLELGIDIYEITDGWKGVNGFPSGVCPQLSCIVPGPLHATASLIERDLGRWRNMFDE
jgi:hypothetical protein